MSHERLERTLKMNRTRFKRRTGIYPETFCAMESVLVERENTKRKSGRPAALSLAEQLVLKEAENVFKIIAIDAAETPCERPKKSSVHGTAARKSATP